MKRIILKEFQASGDLFYTNTVKMYCNMAEVDSISSFDEIDNLQKKVTELMAADKNCNISSSVDKKNLLNIYFTELKIALRNA